MRDEAAERDKVLSEIGRGYIEMRHNRARGYMVLINDEDEKLSVIVYNISQDEFAHYALKIAEDAIDSIEEESEDD